LSYNDLLKSIGYNDFKTQKKRINIDNKYFNTFENIYKLSKLNKYDIKNIQPHTKMINESGLYLILSKSNKNLAKSLLETMFVDILPSLRKKGSYSLSVNEKNKMKNFTKKILNYKKENEIKLKTHKIYNDVTGYGFIYVLETKILKDGNEKKCYKIGYTKDLNKRLNTYKTGHPDIVLVHSENVNCNKKQLEKCVLNLNSLKRLSSKNEIICNNSLDEIKREITDCKKLITKYSNI